MKNHDRSYPKFLEEDDYDRYSEAKRTEHGWEGEAWRSLPPQAHEAAQDLWHSELDREHYGDYVADEIKRVVGFWRLPREAQKVAIEIWQEREKTWK